MAGEIAEMMLDGTLCEQCGVYIDDDAPGYPRNCGCAKLSAYVAPATTTTRHGCPTCGKLMASLPALAQHMRDAHRQRMTIERTP